MTESFDARRALELAAEISTSVAREENLSDVLDRIAELRAWAAGPDAEPFAALLTDLESVATALAHLRERAGAGAHDDDVTGLLNRRGFDEALRREVDRAYRAGQPLGALAVSLDHFERVTASADPEAGDRALRLVADVLRGCLRQVDVAARTGSASFRVLLHGATLDGARDVAERCRCAIAAARVPDLGTLTATFGVAILPEHAANGAALVQSTDAALGTGVRRGRNCVAVAIPIGRR